jgi:hypothetical protein
VRTVNLDFDPGQRSLDDLRRMVGPDRHRPGSAYARLLKEQVHVWAIVGYAKVIAESIDAEAVTDEVVARVAADYDISPEAVRAAMLFYAEHRGAIDAVLEMNNADFA